MSSLFCNDNLIIVRLRDLLGNLERESTRVTRASIILDIMQLIDTNFDRMVTELCGNCEGPELQRRQRLFQVITERATVLSRQEATKHFPELRSTCQRVVERIQRLNWIE